MPPKVDCYAPCLLGGEADHGHFVFLINTPSQNGTGLGQLVHGGSQISAKVNQASALRAAQLLQSGNLHRKGRSVARIEAMQPFGETGLESQPLLPLHLGPAKVKKPGQPGIDLDGRGMLFIAEVKSIDKWAGVGKTPPGRAVLKIDGYLHR